MKPRVLPRIEAMHGYVPGEQPSDDDEVVKLNTNENPYPPSPEVRKAIVAAAADHLERYPAPMLILHGTHDRPNSGSGPHRKPA